MVEHCSARLLAKNEIVFFIGSTMDVLVTKVSIDTYYSITIVIILFVLEPRHIIYTVVSDATSCVDSNYRSSLAKT